MSNVNVITLYLYESIWYLSLFTISLLRQQARASGSASTSSSLKHKACHVYSHAFSPLCHGLGLKLSCLTRLSLSTDASSVPQPDLLGLSMSTLHARELGGKKISGVHTAAVRKERAWSHLMYNVPTRQQSFGTTQRCSLLDQYP